MSVEAPLRPAAQSEEPPSEQFLLATLRKAFVRFSARYRQVRQFAQAYRGAVLSVPGVIEVEFYDQGQWLDVYTHYEGRLDDIEDGVYGVEAGMMRAFPDVHPDWHLIGHTVEPAALPRRVRHETHSLAH